MISNPLALIAEVTHRCPLRCVYCSNPLQLAATKAELSTEDWVRVFQEASRLGVMHLHLTGGEPARWIAGAKVHAYKVILAEKIRALPLAFTVNLVVHRQNLDHIEEMIEFIEQLQPERVEIAHAQYYGWALKNRDALLPTREQLENCIRVVGAAQVRLAGKVRIDSVVPDYYARYPKACMGGWGRRLMLIEPSGQALPCHAAGIIPGMHFDNVRERSLEWIWRESAAFQRFRGEEWMPEPCKSCDRRAEDFGGCRCQALLVTADVTATDPVCSLSPDHHLIELARSAANIDSAEIAWSYRTSVE